jgi:hypothetical protein
MVEKTNDMSEQQMNKEQMPGPPSLRERARPDKSGAMEGDAFYIGWQPNAPSSFVKHVKKVLLVLFPAALLIGFFLSSSQKKFSTANFEFGSLTQVTGVYYSSPVPLLKVADEHNASILIPLVGYGKHGAEGVLTDIEKAKSVSLNQKQITLKGTLLYSDGKVLMQIDANDAPLLKVEEAPAAFQKPISKELGTITVKGEVIDPKCYFGVMKPGEGKVHKDCAIRCILGGIPPVLKVENKNDERNYYLIVGPNGEKINEAVKDFVAEPVAITAKAVQYDDWIILYLNNDKSISRISGAAMVRPDLAIASCTPACTK